MTPVYDKRVTRAMSAYAMHALDKKTCAQIGKLLHVTPARAAYMIIEGRQMTHQLLAGIAQLDLAHII